MVWYGFDPILFVHFCPPAVVASDPHLLMVELEFNKVATDKFVIMWGGFDMKPHNIFDNTPFFPDMK